MGLLDLIQSSPDGGMGLLGSVLSRVDAMKRRGKGLLSSGGVDQLVASLAEDARANANLAGQGIENAQSVMPGMASIGAQQIYDAGSPAALALQTVYHGSPHTFDKFDMSKIGTGEGAQAYGHGLYFADNPDVAQEYQRWLAARNGPSGVDRNSGGFAESAITNMFINRKAAGLSDETARAQTLRWASDHPQIGAEKAAEIVPRLATNHGNLYRVDIPDEAIGRMLQWDKPLSEQPRQIQEAAAKALGKGIYRPLSDADLAEVGNMTGSAFYQALTGKRLAETAMGRMPPTGYDASQDASALLHTHGIPGIRYLDQGSRGAGQGTYNTVLFDPALATILGRE